MPSPYIKIRKLSLSCFSNNILLIKIETFFTTVSIFKCVKLDILYHLATQGN